MLARLKVTPNLDSYKNVCIWQDSKIKKQSFWNKVLKIRGLYQQYVFYDDNLYRLSTLGLSLYPKENEHSHYSWVVVNLKQISCTLTS